MYAAAATVAHLDLHDWRCYAFGANRTTLIGLRCGLFINSLLPLTRPLINRASLRDAALRAPDHCASSPLPAAYGSTPQSRLVARLDLHDFSSAFAEAGLLTPFIPLTSYLLPLTSYLLPLTYRSPSNSSSSSIAIVGCPCRSAASIPRSNTPFASSSRPSFTSALASLP
jgi:hypothetical protein